MQIFLTALIKKHALNSGSLSMSKRRVITSYFCSTVQGAYRPSGRTPVPKDNSLYRSHIKPGGQKAWQPYLINVFLIPRIRQSCANRFSFQSIMVNTSAPVQNFDSILLIPSEF